MKNKFLLFALCCGFTYSAFSQSLRSIESIGIDNITIIEIAGNGDVWAGSASQGVAFYRADSAKWSYFDSLNTPMRSNSVTSIAVSPVAGVLHSFIGTLSGGVITQIGAWDTIAQVSGTSIRGIAYRPDSLWVVTGPNIIRYDSSFNHVQNYASAHPAITCVKSGTMQNCAGFWFGTLNSGAYFTSNGATLSDSLNTSVGGKQMVSNHVNALAVDVMCDRVFVGTTGGFSSCPLVGPPCLNYTTANGLPQNDITAVVVGCNNNVWLGTRDSGVVVYNTTSQQFSRVTTANNNVTAMACAQNCVAYVGAKDGSITQVDSNKTVIGVMSGIKTLNQEEFAVNVFPQPSGTEINFAFGKEIANGDLYLTDINGRTLQHLYLKNANRITANVSELSNGIYFYQLFSTKQLLTTGKVVVAR